MHSLSSNSLCFKLFNSLSSSEDGNFIISPVSIWTALMMVYSGARKETAFELKQLLNIDHLSDENIFDLNQKYIKQFEVINGQVDLSIANRLFVANNFNLLDDFESLLAKYFESEAQNLNFSNPVESAEIINSFVELKTKNKIKNLIDPELLDSLTKLVLINAVYFKGNWKHKFEKCETQEENFFLKNGLIKKVQMMTSLTKKFSLKINPAGLKAKTCEFPYEGDQISMTIILPNEESNINEVEAQLNTDALENILDAHDTVPVRVEVHVPKFKLEFKTELSQMLIKMGASSAFSADNSDFTRISKDARNLHISNVLHKAVIEVNEVGTEAAAATAVIMRKRCVEFPEEFKCNRPFIFLIHEKKGNNVLFIGKYMNPE